MMRSGLGLYWQSTQKKAWSHLPSLKHVNVTVAWPFRNVISVHSRYISNKRNISLSNKFYVSRIERLQSSKVTNIQSIGLYRSRNMVNNNLISYNNPIKSIKPGNRCTYRGFSSSATSASTGPNPATLSRQKADHLLSWRNYPLSRIPVFTGLEYLGVIVLGSFIYYLYDDYIYFKSDDNKYVLDTMITSIMPLLSYNDLYYDMKPQDYITSFLQRYTSLYLDLCTRLDEYDIDHLAATYNIPVESILSCHYEQTYGLGLLSIASMGYNMSININNILNIIDQDIKVADNIITNHDELFISINKWHHDSSLYIPSQQQLQDAILLSQSTHNNGKYIPIPSIDIAREWKSNLIQLQQNITAIQSTVNEYQYDVKYLYKRFEDVGNDINRVLYWQEDKPQSELQKSIAQIRREGLDTILSSLSRLSSCVISIDDISSSIEQLRSHYASTLVLVLPSSLLSSSLPLSSSSSLTSSSLTSALPEPLLIPLNATLKQRYPDILPLSRRVDAETQAVYRPETDKRSYALLHRKVAATDIFHNDIISKDQYNDIYHYILSTLPSYNNIDPLTIAQSQDDIRKKQGTVTKQYVDPYKELRRIADTMGMHKTSLYNANMSIPHYNTHILNQHSVVYKI